MTDFFQTGSIATLHRLGFPATSALERQLMQWRAQAPIALVLPALYAEFEGPAMPKIIEELRGVEYLKRIVVTLGRADEDQLEKARRAFDGFRTPVTFVWNDGPGIQALYRLLRENELPVGEDGKGRSCWMAYGYVLAEGDCDVIALHDCDIVTYSRDFLARLCYPVASPDLTYAFCKGYYARVTDRLHGRVTRLLVTPLIRSLMNIAGSHRFLDYLNSFRYPLAGEFAMRSDLARVNRIPADWGLEVGVLSEIYRNLSVKRICQAELCETYEHKHQSLDPAEAGKGLMKMSLDIAKNLFRILAADGLVFSEGTFKTLLAHYVREAEDLVVRYHADAAINGLAYDRHEEESAVEAFAKAIRSAGASYLDDPLGIPLIPNWNRITSAFPDFFDQLKAAVKEDNR
jgi:glucosyl-3-phosphoglycerate synthase